MWRRPQRCASHPHVKKGTRRSEQPPQDSFAWEANVPSCPVSKRPEIAATFCTSAISRMLTSARGLEIPMNGQAGQRVSGPVTGQSRCCTDLTDDRKWELTPQLSWEPRSQNKQVPRSEGLSRGPTRTHPVSPRARMDLGTKIGTGKFQPGKVKTQCVEPEGPGCSSPVVHPGKGPGFG